MLQPNPRAAPDALTELEITEGDLCADHRHILKNHIVGNDRDQQQIQLPVFSQ